MGRIRATSLTQITFRPAEDHNRRAEKLEMVRSAVLALQAASGGGGGHSFSSVSASYAETATSGEKVVAVTASGQTITLPSAVGNTAKLQYKLMVPGTLTLDGNGSQTIDDGATAVLTAQYEAITLVSDNANWIVI